MCSVISVYSVLKPCISPCLRGESLYLAQTRRRAMSGNDRPIRVGVAEVVTVTEAVAVREGVGVTLGVRVAVGVAVEVPGVNAGS